jgi:hypothetical protein
MPLAIIDHPAEPHCGGFQWTVANIDQLAGLVATVLQGRARHASNVLAGATHLPASTPDRMKEQIRTDLFPASQALIYHRDGLLFEIICWMVSRDTAGPGDIISEPHTRATQQGVDTFKVTWNDAARTLISATIYEYKCTTGAQAVFRGQVMGAFKAYFDGDRDPQLVQQAIALLDVFQLTDQEQRETYSRIIYDRPLVFDAALTVQPPPYGAAACVDLFDRYATLGARPQRLGSTMPLDDIRAWFENFAALVWTKIDV